MHIFLHLDSKDFGNIAATCKSNRDCIRSEKFTKLFFEKNQDNFDQIFHFNFSTLTRKQIYDYTQPLNIHGKYFIRLICAIRMVENEFFKENH